jgi:antitoxin ParD1/3/4
MANRETRTLSFTPEQAAFLTGCVASGRYQSQSEVVRAALRLLENEEARRAAELARVRAMVAEGVADLDRGDVVDGARFFAEWDERLRQRKGGEPVKPQ